MDEDSAMAVGSNEPVVGASEVRKLEERVRDLERILGGKTMENGILQEALVKAQAKKQSAFHSFCSHPTCLGKT